MPKRASFSRDCFESEFDLLAAIRESQSTYDKQDKDQIKWLSLHRLPKYVIANVDRVIAGEEVSHEEARWCCIEFGIGRLYASGEYKAWEALQELALSKESQYREDGDWDDVQERLTTFRFQPTDCHQGTRSVNARIPEPIKAQVSGAAKVLGMSATTVATICLIDALRELEFVMHKKDLNATMSEFYRLLRRRTRRLRRLLVEVEVLEPGEAP